MPEFTTDGPVDLAIDLPVGRVEVTASDRDDVDVRVEPSNPAKNSDVRAAADTTVEHVDGRITVAAPHRHTPFGGSESLDITVEVPAGSRLTVDNSVGRIHTHGALGATRVKTATSEVDIERAEHLQVRSSSGAIVVGHVDGDLDITAGNGSMRIDYAGGRTTLKASNGDIHVGVAGGVLTAKLANGSIDIGAALDSVSAKSSLGTLRVDEVSNGTVQLDASHGEVIVGIRPGVAAWLDVQSKNGTVRNAMTAAAAPTDVAGTVEVRARTSFGDITVRPAVVR